MEKGLSLDESIVLGVPTYTLHDQSFSSLSKTLFLYNCKRPDLGLEVIVDDEQYINDESFIQIIESGLLLAQKVAIQDKIDIIATFSIKSITDGNKETVKKYGLRYAGSETTREYPYAWQTVVHFDEGKEE